MLSAELPTEQRSIADAPPEQGLGLRLVAPQAACLQLLLHLRAWVTRHAPLTRLAAARHPLPQAGEGSKRYLPSPARAGEGGARRESDGRVRARSPCLI